MRVVKSKYRGKIKSFPSGTMEENLAREDFSHMFERFHTGQNGNSGIGLALSKEIVEMHGWKLSAKNDRHGICLSMVCHS
ncbi:MAG: ATP-binding protein [Ruminococcus sp.]